MHRVTVVSAIFNIVKAGRTKVFLKNLESVHNQTYDDIEHIVVDGGSTDGTLKILEKYAKKGWIKYISEPDKGIYDAMNKGARMGTGDYVAFLNSDDYWFDKRGVEYSVRALLEQNADFSFAPSYTTQDDFPRHKCATSIGNFFMRMPFCHQTMFTRREVFLKLGAYDIENFRSAGDFHFIQRLILSGHKPAYVPHNFTAYSHGGFSAVDMETSNQECIKAMHMEFSKFYPEFTREDADRAFRTHTISEQFLRVMIPRIAPLISSQLLALPKDYIEVGKTESGEVKYDVKFNLYPYSYAISSADFAPGSSWKMYYRCAKLFGIPLFSRTDTTEESVVRILGIPVWTARSGK